ncbi:MAG: transferrin-binding protein-like solute binding protein [Pseudooceanicola sp.]
MRIFTSIRPVAVIALGMTLGACTELPGLADLSFGELEAEGVKLDLEMLNAQPTPVADMPKTGTADYVGAVAFGDTQPTGFTGSDLVARVTLEADFKAKTLGGTIDNFRSASQPDFDGNIDIQSGLIVGSTMVANLEGTMDAPATGNSGQFTGTMAGTFQGASGEFITGGINGAIQTTTGATNTAGLFHARVQ